MLIKVEDKSKFMRNCKFIISLIVAFLVLTLLVFVLLRGLIADSFIMKADLDLEAGQYEQAVKGYKTALFWKPDKQIIYLSMTDAYLLLKDYENAHLTIDTAIEKRLATKNSGLEELYYKKIEVFVKKGDIAQAALYIDNIDDQYISRKLSENRPAFLTYSPTQGSYDKSQRVVISVAEGEQVFYTTDGSNPTNKSSIYQDAIAIGKGETTITAVAVNDNNMVSPLLRITYNVENANEEINFIDSKVEKMVRKSLLKPVGAKIYARELEFVVNLSNEGISGKITSLGDLELMPNLESLIMPGETGIMSWSKISGKSKLRYLDLSGCTLGDSSINAIAGLSGLKELVLANNNISALTAFSELEMLERLDLSYNNILDITPLFTNLALRSLNLSSNSITSIRGLEAITVLEELDVSNNLIDELPAIHHMGSVKALNLSGNPLKNLKNLSTLTGLVTLKAANCQLTNIDFVKDMKNLSVLSISNNDIATIKQLSSLKLSELYLAETYVGDLAAIEDMTTLVRLDIANTRVENVDIPADLPRLEYLNISNCDIETVAPLKNCITLNVLVCADIPAMDIALLVRDGLTIE